MPADSDEVLRTPEVAKLLGMHRDSVRALVDDGKLSCFLTPGGHRRFRRADVEAYKAAQAVEPEPAAS